MTDIRSLAGEHWCRNIIPRVGWKKGCMAEMTCGTRRRDACSGVFRGSRAVPIQLIEVEKVVRAGFVAPRLPTDRPNDNGTRRTPLPAGSKADMSHASRQPPSTVRRAPSLSLPGSLHEKAGVNAGLFKRLQFSCVSRRATAPRPRPAPWPAAPASSGRGSGSRRRRSAGW